MSPVGNFFWWQTLAQRDCWWCHAERVFLMFFGGFSHVVSLGVNVVLGVHVCVLPCQVVLFWFIETVLAVVIVAVHGNALAMACLLCLCWKVRVHSA